MQGGNLTGHVEAIDRHHWRLIVNLPAASGGARRRYPRTVRTVDASGKRAAEAMLADWIGELERHDCTDPSRLTVAELCRRWLTAIRFDVRPATLEFYGDKLRYVLPTLGASIAVDVRPVDLSTLYVNLQDRGLSATTAHHAHAIVRAAYSWAVREELLDRNPALRVKHPPALAPGERSVWSTDDVARAIVASDGLQVRVPLVLAAWAGLRRGEVCGLRWQNVDLEAGRIWVCEALEETKGGVLHTVAPKSRAGLRLLPFPARGVELLRLHKARQDEMRMAIPGWNKPGYVVATVDGRPMKPDNLSSAWAQFVKRKRLPAVSFHDLRHSYTTGIFDRGGENRESMLKVAQRLAGHADPMTTARIYLHATEPLLEQVHVLHNEAVEAAMAKAESNSHSISTPPVSLEDHRSKNPSK